MLVVDDGSTDGTPAVIARHGGRVRAFHQANAGPAAARNLGLREARGAFIAFLDADDLWAPTKLERQYASFERRPELDLSVTMVQNFWTADLRDEEAHFSQHRLAQPVPGYSTVALLARRSVFDRVGCFDESWRHVHDTEWFARVRAHGLITDVLPDVLVHRRLHATNRSRLGAAASRDEYLQMVQASLTRQRGRSPRG